MGNSTRNVYPIGYHNFFRWVCAQREDQLFGLPGKKNCMLTRYLLAFTRAGYIEMGTYTVTIGKRVFDLPKWAALLNIMLEFYAIEERIKKHVKRKTYLDFLIAIPHSLFEH